METAKLKKFAQFARRTLMEQVSTKLKLVLAENSAARRESVESIHKLEESISLSGQEQVIERVAYIWFNRFCALRFMDVNRYNPVNIVSPADPGQFQPEILAEAKMGHIDEKIVQDKVRQQIFALLDGKAPSRDPQGEAYRMLVVAACNFWNKAMPFLFQRIDDYTELLMPDDLLSGNSILAYTREAMTPEACEDVEVIGWLYQFYISEKKDEVFNGLKKNKKIAPENIPAATQLFTPHWIVRYLVENSLGRLWMLNRPASKLVERMDYYIKPEQAETDFLRINKPEEIKICDPACGSGHMLTYAFDLLYAIYEEEGYEPAEIPEKILTNNLYGIEIDERAGELAAFALTMKARAKQRRFFSKDVKPNICVLENIHFDEGELKSYMDFVGRDLFTAPLETTLRQFEEADNFGSLIRPDVTDVDGMLSILESKNVSGHLFLSKTHHKVLQALQQADYLSPKYHVVIANPPYMGGKGMNGRLGTWAKDNYPTSKADLFAMFIERGLELVSKYGYSAMVTMQSWMFLSSYESLRIKLLSQTAIESMSHMANMVMGIAFGTTATVWKVGGSISTKGSYCYIEYENLGADNKPILFPPHNERNQKASAQGWFYHASAADFKKIPGSPLAYWVSQNVISIFSKSKPLSNFAEIGKGLDTGDNNQFLRLWFETQAKSNHWVACQKGGPFRKWYGNNEHVINWANNGEELIKFSGSNLRNSHNYFKSGLSWTRVSSSNTAFRFFPKGQIFESTGPCLFPTMLSLYDIAGFLNSKVTLSLLRFLAPTLDFQSGHISSIPIAELNWNLLGIKNRSSCCIIIAQKDWDSYETSWDFTSLPLLNPDYRQQTLKTTYQKLRAHWREMTMEMQRLEEENNHIFIEAYGLQDELTPEVPLNEITLTCNPHYRYGVEECEAGSEKWEAMEARLLKDTMKEFVSYAVGCMFGRYSLDLPGLVLANQGEGIADYFRKLEEFRNNECKELSGTDRLAESDGFGGNDLSGIKAIPEGRTIRSDESDSQSGSLDPLEHCGRTGEAIDGRIQKLPVDSTGFQGRSGDPTDDRAAFGIPVISECYGDLKSHGGDQTHDLLSDGEALLTPHFPLSTSHSRPPRFEPDVDNVIPMLDGDWFADDITERFRKFLRVTFGEEHYEENLRFIEQSLNIKDKRNYSIRDYFLGEFYNDHVKRYKKRPIYWLFSSPKGSFNALIYMHRYRPDTVSVVLNEYLREFRSKLVSHKNHLEAVSRSESASQSEKTGALKETEKVAKMISEIEEYERVVLYPLATKQREIDLDKGVKVNYQKFGSALKLIHGLEANDG
jgi:type II restriction/modification system DNA methylase subunit YeeA